VIQNNGTTGTIRNLRGNYSGLPWNGVTNGAAPGVTVNMRLANTPLAAFICPSDPGPRESVSQAYPNRYGAGPGLSGQRTNYDFITVTASDFGTCNWWRTAPLNQRYYFGESSTTKIEDAKDGSSNTFMLGETLVEPRCNGWGEVWAYRGWVQTGLDPGTARVSASETPNQGINNWTLIASWNTTLCNSTGTNPGRLGRLGDWGRVGSLHGGGGCHFAMGDGSIRFVRESTPATTLRAMALIADGTTVNTD
jgi:hypothetical protein